MNRRQLLKMVALGTGSAVIGADFFLSGCKNPDSGKTGTDLSDNDIKFMDEVAETIIPKTTTAGAKEAEVGKFMMMMVNDCYDEADQKIFHSGIKKLDEACIQKHGQSFMKANTSH